MKRSRLESPGRCFFWAFFFLFLKRKTWPCWVVVVVVEEVEAAQKMFEAFTVSKGYTVIGRSSNNIFPRFSKYFGG